MADFTAPSPVVSARMAKVRNRDTAAEMAIRRELHRRGLRYRVSRQIPGLGRVRPDIVFSRQQVAVFVDGCFWHRCPEHATDPKTNADWWEEKLAKNVERDRKADMEVERAGWAAIRVWEHEDPAICAARIIEVLEQKTRPSPESHGE